VETRRKRNEIHHQLGRCALLFSAPSLVAEKFRNIKKTPASISTEKGSALLARPQRLPAKHERAKANGHFKRNPTIASMCGKTKQHRLDCDGVVGNNNEDDEIETDVDDLPFLMNAVELQEESIPNPVIQDPEDTTSTANTSTQSHTEEGADIESGSEDSESISEDSESISEDSESGSEDSESGSEDSESSGPPPLRQPLRQRKRETDESEDKSEAGRNVIDGFDNDCILQNLEMETTNNVHPFGEHQPDMIQVVWVEGPGSDLVYRAHRDSSAFLSVCNHESSEKKEGEENKNN